MELQKQLETLKAENKALLDETTQHDQEMEELETELETLEKENEKLVNQVEELKEVKKTSSSPNLQVLFFYFSQHVT